MGVKGDGRKRGRWKPAVHIQSESYLSRALCGTDWVVLRLGLQYRIRGGRVASDTDPPAVVDEAGSANAVTCRTCLAVWRRRVTSR